MQKDKIEACVDDDFLEKYYWNEKFQALLEKPVTNQEEGNKYETVVG